MQLRWAVPAGTAALALSALAALAGALAIEGNRHRVPPAPGTGLVRAEIKSVAVAGGSPPIGVIVLAPAAIPLVVPLFVTAGEASIVGERHAADGHARLPAAALASLGAKLTGVVLDGTENPTARAELSTPEGPRSIDASVGEALEWAAAAGAAIWLTPTLVHARGIAERQLEQLAPGLGPRVHDATPPAPEGPTL